jgi:hypothetical protein
MVDELITTKYGMSASLDPKTSGQEKSDVRGMKLLLDFGRIAGSRALEATRFFGSTKGTAESGIQNSGGKRKN